MTEKPLTEHDLKLRQVVHEEFARWLAENNRKRDQSSIQSFATYATKGGTEDFYGLKELQLIIALGGTKPRFW
jgi:hypothetical protein